MSDQPGAYIYILRCADDSYYAGSARLGLNQRLAEHNAGRYSGYTASRRPVTLVWCNTSPKMTDAITVERQIKGWNRRKKEALMRGDYEALRSLASRATKPTSS